MTILNIKTMCTRCDQETAGRLHLEQGIKLVDSDGGIVFEAGWTCHTCLGEPWDSGDATAAVLR